MATIPVYESSVEITDKTLEKQTQLKEELDWAKGQELDHRVELCGELFGENLGEFHVKGETEKYKYRASSKMTRTLDQELFKECFEDETLSEAAKECFEMVPKFSKAKLDKLDEDDDLWECFTEKPATPTIAITEK